MAYYINNTGKIMAAGLAAGAAKAAITGDSTELKSGCLGFLVVWLCWVAFVLFTIYWLIFG